MKITSSEAAKLLRKLNEELASLRYNENQSREFVASVGEDIESVRPEYDYAETQAQIEVLEGKIRALKHAINVFNITHRVEGFDMTIDQMLVYIPQLTEKRSKLYTMKNCLPKTRDGSVYGKTGSIIDYRYANYDIAQAKSDFEKVADMLSRAQIALDRVNSTETLEIDIEI